MTSKRNIHTGIDITVPAKEPVFSLCAGNVVYDNTSANYWNSFLIIKHTCGDHQFYAYYGHVHSSVADPKNIRAGEVIATIKHDESGYSGDHLHLSISTGDNWDQYGWGYDYSCQHIIADGYINPLLYLDVAEENPEIPEAPPDQKDTNLPDMRFDVKSPFIEKDKLAATKAGFIAYIQQSGWAQVTEIGEDYSLWLTDYKRAIDDNVNTIRLTFEVRSPAMFSRGKLLRSHKVNVTFDTSALPNSEPVDDHLFLGLIKKHFQDHHITPTPEKETAELMNSIFRKGWSRNPTSHEALEGIIVGAHLMKVLEDEFTTRQ